MNCAVCGVEIEVHRNTKRYCGSSCRTAAYIQRQNSTNAIRVIAEEGLRSTNKTPYLQKILNLTVNTIGSLTAPMEQPQLQADASSVAK